MISPIEHLQTNVDRFSEDVMNLSISGDTVEYPPNEDMGDLAINYSMKAAEQLDENPRDIAGQLQEYLDDNIGILSEVTVEGPGFVNCNFSDDYFLNTASEIIESENLPLKHAEKKESILLEFVSANPTGPLHVGHGRGAVYGDVIGRLLTAHGYEVDREYYVNDTGEQIKRLTESLKLRAREQEGETVKLSGDHYKGEYVKTIVNEKNITPDMSNDQCARIGIDYILDDIFEVLKSCEIEFDSVRKESDLTEGESFEKVLEKLKEGEATYTENDAIFLRTSNLGDDKDRVLVKGDGRPTYFANDLVYHHQKFDRDYDRMINVWGHDHHGYVDRLTAGLSMLGHESSRLEIELYQLVDLYRDGDPLAMSTREGEFVSLEELIDEVGTDAVRFNFLTKNHERPLDFDIDVATSEDEENPVYYVQYAHTRMTSIIREAPDSLTDVEPEQRLTRKGHKLLLKGLNFRHHLFEATRSNEPHRIPHYLIDLARQFHSYYNEHQVIDQDHLKRSCTRLLLVRFLKFLFSQSLSLLGVSAPERM